MDVRCATADDAAACAAIYAPFVRDTAVSFEAEPPDAAEMATRIAASSAEHAWLVATDRGRVVGYAYAGPFKTRAAYRWACETSVYVDPTAHARGVGRALYDGLLARLVERGFQTAAAGMTLPNDASERFHAALGFEPVGTWRRIGFKFGAWHDVHWMQRRLADETRPAEPR